MWSFVYFAFGPIVELMMLCFRRRESNEVEILLLRHILVISSRARGWSRKTEPRRPLEFVRRGTRHGRVQSRKESSAMTALR